ncbi:oxidoreductase [Candidatus Dependentiae bacterium]|nr:oxidoreductase [Candidatus Dependentiae bacterium]
MSKAKIAIFWAASCGGCDIATLDIHETLIPLLEKIEFVFWPCAMDFKYADVESMPDKNIDVCLFNGAIRNSENEHVAKLLRKKSKLMVAFGACSSWGGIPALINFSTNKETFDWVYKNCPSADNNDGIIPKTHTKHDGYDLELPELYDTTKKLSDVVDVDYYVPGCPPVPNQIVAVVSAILEGKLPPKGSVVGAGEKNLCDECKRTRKEKKIKKFVRIQEMESISSEECLLDQGMLCMGPVTRSGCGALCPAANVGCDGCYGPASGIKDTGLKMVSALASVIDSKDEKEIEKIIDTISDPAGRFYKYTMSQSLLKRKAVKK